MTGRMIGAAALAITAILTAHGAMAADDAPEAAAAAAASKFYQKVDVASCSGGTCTATFTKIPAGKVLQTTNLSCSANADGFNAIPAFARLQVGKTILTYMPLNPFSSGSATIATGVLGGTVFVTQGQTPSVVIPGGAVSATCTLSGTLAAAG